MTKKYDLCIIGAGSGGLSVAAGAAQMGAPVVLIENRKMGGDCLNYGCVPSKAILAAAKTAKHMREADKFGVQGVTPRVDYEKVRAHVREVIAEIAPNDSVERFEGFGVKVIHGDASFIAANKVSVNDQEIRAKRFVIATGSSPLVPSIDGLNNVDYLTNETIFDLAEQPSRLIVIGGGPIGCEMAQAHAMLGTPVTVVAHGAIMPRDDQELVPVVRDQLQQDGVELCEAANPTRVEKTAEGIIVHYEQAGEQKTVSGSHLLIATGRKANIAHLGLEKAGVVCHERGIQVDNRLRTSNKKIFAIGDVAGPYLFTHMAGYHAGIVIRNALFHLPAKVNYNAVPWVTYVDPELAHVGMSEAEAKQHDSHMRTLEWPFTENDRAQTEKATNGKAKVFVSKKGYILGATIVGHNAGELIMPWSLAITQKLKIGAMANVIAPYPTLSEINKRVAGSYYIESLFSPKMKRIVKFLQLF